MIPAFMRVVPGSRALQALLFAATCLQAQAQAPVQPAFPSRKLLPEKLCFVNKYHSLPFPLSFISLPLF